MRKNSGFTLIELLVVISIIAILSAVVLAFTAESRAKARDARRLADLAEIRKALELYYATNGYYPDSVCVCGYDCNGYRHSASENWDGLAAELAPYLSELPKDPINNHSGSYNVLGPDACYTYMYGNVGWYTNSPTYDLMARLETTDHPQSCGRNNWRFYFTKIPVCISHGGSLSDSFFVMSP